MWDADSGEELLVLRGHEDSVNAVCYSPDGGRIVSGSREDVRVWDSESGECLEAVRGQGDVAAIATGRERFPWRALMRDGETVIEAADTVRPVAWHSDGLRPLTTHPSGRIWAGGAM